jgi:hypothetical protein
MKLLLSSIALSLLMATPALAAKKAPKNNYPWFAQLSLGGVIKSDAEEQAIADLNKLGHDVIDYTYESSNKSFQFELGYSLNDNWAVTAGYMDFGRTSFEPKIATGYGVELIDEIAKTAPRYGNGNTFSLVYSFDLASSISASVDVGIIYLESKSEIQLEYVTYEIKDHSLQYFMSAGLDYKFDDFQVGLYARHYEIDQVGSEWLGVRLGYHF